VKIALGAIVVFILVAYFEPQRVDIMATPDDGKENLPLVPIGRRIVFSDADLPTIHIGPPGKR